MLAPLTTTAATVITTLELKEASHLTRFMKSTELFGEPSFQTKHLDPGVRSRVDTSPWCKAKVRVPGLWPKRQKRVYTIRHYEKVGVPPRASWPITPRQGCLNCRICIDYPVEVDRHPSLNCVCSANGCRVSNSTIP